MQFTSSILAILATVSLVAASGMVTPSEVEAQQCGNGNKISCCNSGDSTAEADGLLGLAGLNSVLGGTCEQIPINVIGVLVPIQDMCGNLNAACCGDSSQSGLVNLSADCTPINLL